MDNRDMADSVQFARMNGLGNKILVVDMRGRKDRVTPHAAVALNADPATEFDQIMAIHDPKAVGTDAWIDIINSDGSMAQACGNGTRCVVQALAAETGKKAFLFHTVAGLLEAKEHDDGTISVDMGSPRFGWSEIPLARHEPDRTADRSDRRSGAAFAFRRLNGQPACDLLGRQRRLVLRARSLRTAP